MAFSQEIADKVCETIAEEWISLRKACDKVGCKVPTFLLWCDQNEALAEQYTRARAQAREQRFEKLREISAEEPERDDKGRIDPGWVQWKRMHIDTEKWSLSKEDAKRYGDKVQTELTGANGGPVQVQEVRRTVVDPRDP